MAYNILLRLMNSQLEILFLVTNRTREFGNADAK